MLEEMSRTYKGTAGKTYEISTVIASKLPGWFDLLVHDQAKESVRYTLRSTFIAEMVEFDHSETLSEPEYILRLDSCNKYPIKLAFPSYADRAIFKEKLMTTIAETEQCRW